MTLIRELSEQDVLDISAAAGEPEWLRDRRLEGFAALADLHWPTARDEDWRHTNPRRVPLDRELLRKAPDVPVPDRGVIAAVADDLGAHARMVDGTVVETTVSDDLAAQGLVITEFATADEAQAALIREHLGTVVKPDEIFAAANLAAFGTGLLVHVPAGVELDRPLAITVQAATDGTSFSRVLVVLGHHAKAQLYVNHAGGPEATVSEVVEAVVGDGATLESVLAQDWGEGVAHVANHRASVGREARYRSLEVTLGGHTVYVRPDVGLDREGAEGELLGVYFGSDGQHFEHRSQIHHNASHTTSKSVYKGALQGESRATWFGNIRIEKHAKATVSDETNRNLILTRGAKADSIPFLEIETADVVSCGHHSSVGQLDELQLFYLESRGIPRDEAARMLVFGFFTEVLDTMGLPGVTDTVIGEIADEVRAAPTTVMDQRRR